MAADVRLPIGGVELAIYGTPSAGLPVLCLHETGATAASWSSFAAAVAAGGETGEAIRYDRRGWGSSSAPEPYLRTTVGEQAQDALGVLDGLGIEQATLVGAGIGAVAALDLALREPARVKAAIAVEPPLLALADGATEGLSHDLETLRDAAEQADQGGGRQAAADLFTAGELPFLAPGAERLSAREAAGGGDGGEPGRRLSSLIAELGAVPAWPLPFEALAESSVPLAIVIGAATPAPLRQAATVLVAHAPGARLIDLTEPDPLSAGAALVELVD